MIILDLDDTIFETRSMNPTIFDSAISVLSRYYNSDKTEIESTEVIEKIWSIPIDQVFAEYDTPDSVVSEFFEQISLIDYKSLKIKAFEDYKEIKTILTGKILVTTGLVELQMAKIKALNIEADFDSIHIDDPRQKPRDTKSQIFKRIINKTKKDPEEFWVIGDNPDSEIIAGRELGMRTIQRISKTKRSSEFADYQIKSFEELTAIMN